MEFMIKLHEILSERNMTQEELARKMGVTSSALSQMLSNPQRTIRTKRRIARALGIPLEDICCGIGETIRGFMKKRNITQAELAKAMRVTQATISATLQGNITYSTLTRIAYALGCEVKDLISGEGERTQSPLPKLPKAKSWHPYTFHSNNSYNIINN